MIAIDGVTKSFGAFRALDDVSLEIPEGSLTALLGHTAWWPGHGDVARRSPQPELASVSGSGV